MSRLLSVDILRTIAIFSMVQIHFFENLAPPLPHDPFYQFVHFTYELLAAPVFTFLVGFSFYLSIWRQAQHPTMVCKLLSHALKRGLFLFFLGFVFACLVWGWKDLFDWDILPFIGFSIVVLGLSFRLPVVWHILFAVLLMVLAPLGQMYFDFFAPWDALGSEYDAEFTFQQISLGFLIRGYFPLLPWLIYPHLGFSVAKIFFPEGRLVKPQLFLCLAASLLGCGLGFLLLAQMGISHPLAKLYISPWTLAYSKYPVTTSFLLTSLGLTFALLAIFSLSFDSKPIYLNSRLGRFATRYSTFSLTVYVIHHCLHIWPLKLYGLIKASDGLAYYSKALNFYTSLALGLVFVLGFNYVLKYWQQAYGKYSLEWCLRRLTS